MTYSYLVHRGIMHDSEMYPNPFEFDPERFLGAEPQQDTLKWVFGFGRRVSVSRFNLYYVYDLRSR